MRFRAASVVSGFLLLSILWLSGCRSAPAVPENAAADRPEATLAPPKVTANPLPVPPEPLPPTVGRAEAIRQVYRAFPRGIRPLRAPAGVPLAFCDLDADGQLECMVASATARGLPEAEFLRLADPARLFEEDAEPVPFQLVLFAEKAGTLAPLKVVPLGEHLVFDALRTSPLGVDSTAPTIVTVGFLTSEGKEVELLVFDDATGVPRYRRTLSETLATRFQLADIDGDGTLDLVLFERAMEEGTGYETFLSWHRWSGRSFREYRTTNVVRNLNSFLDQVQEQLLTHRPSELLASSLLPTALQRLRKQGLGPDAVVVRVLGLDPAEFPTMPEVRELVYPPILENPFTALDREGWYFDLSFRIIDSGGGSSIATTRVYMLANPFAGRQFALAPPVR